VGLFPCVAKRSSAASSLISPGSISRRRCRSNAPWACAAMARRSRNVAFGAEADDDDDLEMEEDKHASTGSCSGRSSLQAELDKQVQHVDLPPAAASGSAGGKSCPVCP
jgi:hypothetical protein